MHSLTFNQRDGDGCDMRRFRSFNHSMCKTVLYFSQINRRVVNETYDAETETRLRLCGVSRQRRDETFKPSLVISTYTTSTV